MVVRCPVLVGREAELARLLSLTERAHTGAGGWVTVAGEAGVGKSRLVGEMIDRIAPSGVTVVIGRCSPADGLTPFRPLAEALLLALRGQPPPTEPALQPYLPTVSRFVPEWRRGAGAVVSDSPTVIGESVLRVLAWLATSQRLTVVLEDLHWADAETIAVCQYLADHVAETAVGVIATMRTGEGTTGLQELAGRAPAFTLAPMSEPQVAEMAAACLGAQPTAETLDLLGRGSVVCHCW